MNYDLLSHLKTDPMAHIETIQGVKTVLPYQRKVIESVYKYERTVVAAAHDLGKTWLASKIILAFTSTFDGAKVITTAPTFNQVKRLLWSEIRSGYEASRFPLGGEMLMTEWKLAADWFAVGFTSRNEKIEGEGQGGASTFQGFHGSSILVVFDEATGISAGIWKQLEGLMTSGHVRFLGIGNPTTKSCEFYNCFTSPAYRKINLTCFDSPNFPANNMHTMADLTAEYLRVKELEQDEQSEALDSYTVVNNKLLTVRWVMQMILKWGLKHPLVMSKCFGEFPEEDEHTLVPLGVVQTAQYKKYKHKPEDRVCIGVDVARFGTDKTVITEIRGLQVVSRKVMVKRDSNEIAGEIVRRIKECKTYDIHVVVDATGIGAGVIDSLKEKRNEKVIPSQVEIRETHFGGAPYGPNDSKETKDEMQKKYVNLKAKIFIQLAEDLKSDLCLLEADAYLEELPTIRYKFDSKGRWQIESKEEYKARTGRGSPDDADSLALANYGRYDHSGSGNFKRSLIPERNATIISHSRENLW